MKRKLIRGLFGLTGGAFVVVGLYQGVRDQSVWPSAPTTAAALGISCIGVAAAAYSWSVLFPGHRRARRLRAAFLAAQLGKNLPLGSLLQAAGQTGLSVDDDAPKSVVAVNFATHLALQVLAAMVVAIGLAFVPRAPSWLRILAVVVPFIVLLMGRRCVEWIVRLIGPRIGTNVTSLPNVDAIARSLLLSTIPVAAAGLSFGLFVSGFSTVGVGESIPVFAVAWLVGFLAIPFPAGIGIREGVLVALLGQPLSIIAGAAVLQRLVAMAVEGLLAGLNWRNLSRLEGAGA